MKNTIRDVFAAVGHAFAGVDFEGAAASLDADVARMAHKHRVTVVLPPFPPSTSNSGPSMSGARPTAWVVYSRVAADEALMESERVSAVDFDAFDTAAPGEVLNLLVDSGYHRIHAVPVVKRPSGTRALLVAVPQDCESGHLLFAGDVYSDVGLA